MNDFSVRSASDRAGWDAFVQRVTQPNELLESWQWGEFQAAAGHPIQRLEVVRGNNRVAVSLLVLLRTRIGKAFWLSPRGPLVDESLSAEEQSSAWKTMLGEILNQRPPGTMFAKFEPNVIPVLSSDLTPGTATHPGTTLLIDLKKSDEDLMAAMHQKTRYNITLAQRKGVSVRWENSPESVDVFLRLLSATAERQKIGIHPKAYYRAMASTFGPDFEVAIAEYDGQPVAAGIMIRFGNTTTYLHGASDHEHRELMAPYALHWETIKRARQHGRVIYDFYGIAPAGATNHKWAGITRFKRGFGGDEKTYPGAYNVIYDRTWYLAYRFAKRIAGV